MRSSKVIPVSSNFLLKDLDLSPHRKVAGFFLPCLSRLAQSTAAKDNKAAPISKAKTSTSYKQIYRQKKYGDKTISPAAVSLTYHLLITCLSLAYH